MRLRLIVLRRGIVRPGRRVGRRAGAYLACLTHLTRLASLHEARGSGRIRPATCNLPPSTGASSGVVQMSLDLALKFVHVLSAVVAVGANVTYVIWLRLAGRDRERVLFAISGIRFLDRRLANPLYVVVLVTGVAMVLDGQYSFETGWIAAAIALYLLTAAVGIVLFAPALRRQVAAAERDTATAAYAGAASRSVTLALSTTAIVFLIVFLMVTKPF